ncbi:ricin-type beta-trefoil lectin domain protein [Streptomyces sp. NPDC001544]|uniref:ricin-type beta-trefoil lectin domain protein n=1 Tax=Streptomyces sp. NPDC001544 TaxID=3364584 RepID=UPI0036D14638
MNDAGLSNSPTPPQPFDVPDEQLSAELKKWTGATPALHPVGELLDRHWEAAFAYARLCTDGPRAAGMLTTAAFTRLFGATIRQAGPTSAWRPELLVTVRRIAAEWDNDGRQELLHPELRSGTGDGERAAVRMLPPAYRRLISRAFQRLPQSARAVLWHTEVEAEPLATPAALLGLDEEGARVELGRARERLRDECLQAHRELAEDDECLRYIRMLDVTYRRAGVDVDPDLQRHLNGCRHCRHTADQLDGFNTGLGLSLAEAVLGWGAAAYVESRAARAEAPAGQEGGAPSAGDEHAAAIAAGLTGGSPLTGAAPGLAGGESFTDPAPGAFTGAPFTNPAAAPPRGASPVAPEPVLMADDGAAPAASGGEPRRPRGARRAERPGSGGTAPRSRRRSTSRASAPDGEAAADTSSPASRRSAQRAARRVRRRNLSVAVATVSGLVVLPLVLWTVLGSGDGAAPAASGKDGKKPGSGSSTTNPSWVGSGQTAKGTLRGRLHNLASGLCVGVVGKKAVEGAETELATCSSTASQQWTYETDGQLRSAADPGLCLDSHLGYSVQLAPCTAASGVNVRYDFTLQGALVPRGEQDLALAPAATDGAGALVVKTRVDSDVQRWVIDTSKSDLQMQNVNWDADSAPLATSSAPVTPKSAKTPSPAPTPSSPRPAASPSAKPTPSSTASTDMCAYNPYYCGWGGRNGGQYGDGRGGQYGGGWGGGTGYGDGSGFGHGGR